MRITDQYLGFKGTEKLRVLQLSSNSDINIKGLNILF